MKFGERLRQKREAQRLTRAELAKKIGVSSSAIGNYETSLSFPKEEVLLRLFDALPASPDELFCDSYHGMALVLSEAERALLERCRALPPTGQQTMYVMAEMLSQMPTGQGDASAAKA